MKLVTAMKQALSRFTKDTDGVVSVEFIMFAPVLIWATLAGWVYFDAYRQNSVNIKANYTIGDLLSRETEAIDDTYIDSMQSLLELMTRGTESPRLRVTVAMWDEEDSAYKLDWSEARASATPMNATDLNAMATTLPTVMDNERIILVETWLTHEPLMEVGLGTQNFYSFSVTSPRFAPLLAWDS